MTISAPAPAVSDQMFRAQLFRAGAHGAASLAESRRLAAEGLIRRVFADVFVAQDVPDSLPLRAAAAALLIPVRHQANRSWVVGFASAAWVLTGRWSPVPVDLADVAEPTGPMPRAESRPVPGAENRPGPGDARLEVIIGAGRNRPTDPWVHGRQARLSPSEVMLVHGLPVSDPVRTATDVARELPPAPALDLLRLLEEFSGVTPAAVLNRLSDMRYARGAARARVTVAIWQD